MGKKVPECEGVCDFCRDEYEEDNESPPIRKLFRVNGRLMCGMCASDGQSHADACRMAYGE